MGFEYSETDREFIERESERDKQEAERQSKEGPYFLSPGKTTIRILPAHPNARGKWFRELEEHYFEVGESKYFFTAPEDEDDNPFIKKGDELRAIGDTEKAKDFRPRKQFLLNAFVLSAPDGTSLKDGIKVIKFGTMVKRDLVDLDSDFVSGYGDITNLANGMDIVIDRQGKALKTKYTVKAIPARNNVVEKLQNEGLDINDFSLFDLWEMLPVATQEEMEKVVRAVAPPISPTPVASPPQPVSGSVPLGVVATEPTVTNPVPVPTPVPVED